MVIRSAALLSALALASCAAAWGKAYKVEFANESSITVNFDPGLTNMGEMQAVAQKHCAGFGKDAVPSVAQTSDWGLRTTTYLCQKRG